jgi:hypothetical protein
MIIRVIGASRSVPIDDSENFKTFSVCINGAIDPAVQAERLGRVAVSSDSALPGFRRRCCANGLRSNPRHGGRTVCRI